MERKLLNDICRCMDESCPEKQDCLRYICRNSGGDYAVYAESLKEADGTCLSKIASTPKE